MQIYVDADSCPVKSEILKVADRHDIQIHMVANQWMRLERHPLINQVIVNDTFDAADNWIADNISKNDIAITADIPLASRCLEKEAAVIGPTGKPFTGESIGMALAMRDLNAHLRETGEISGGNKPFSKNDRSQFLMTLEDTIQKLLHA